MPLIDDCVRFFGRWNLIDAIVAGVALLLIPLGYGAFLLFRTPMPTVISLEPSRVFEHQPGTVRIVGENLRPFLRARFGSIDAGSLLVASPTTGEIKVLDLPAGTYDLALFDEAREVFRKFGALTVVVSVPLAPAQMEMQAIGAFTYLSDNDVSQVHVGSAFAQPRVPSAAVAVTREQEEAQEAERVAHVLAVRAPEVAVQRVSVSTSGVVSTAVPGTLQVPAIIRLRCAVMDGQCRLGGLAVQKDTMISLAVPVPHAEKFTRLPTYLNFRIDELRPVDAPLEFPFVFPPIRMEMQAIGQFVYLSNTEARRIRVGSSFERPTMRSPSNGGAAVHEAPVVDVLVVRPVETGSQRVRVGPSAVVTTPLPDTLQVPAIVRVRCVVTADQCKVGDAAVTQGALIPLAFSVPVAERVTRPASTVTFRVESLAVLTSPLLRTAEATLRVHFVVRPEVIDLIKAGDTDLADPAAALDIGRASLVSLDPDRKAVIATTRTSAFEFQETVTTVDATVRATAALTPAGWHYKNKPLKVGAPFSFEGLSYAMDGWILSVQVEPDGRIETR